MEFALSCSESLLLRFASALRRLILRTKEYVDAVAIPIIVDPILPMDPPEIRAEVIAGVKTKRSTNNTFAVMIDIVFTFWIE